MFFRMRAMSTLMSSVTVSRRMKKSENLRLPRRESDRAIVDDLRSGAAVPSSKLTL